MCQTENKSFLMFVGYARLVTGYRLFREAPALRAALSPFVIDKR
jgi:hypothetical protein